MKCASRGTGPLRIDILTLSLISIVVRSGAAPLLMSLWKAFHLSWLHLGYACQGEI